MTSLDTMNGTMSAATSAPPDSTPGAGVELLAAEGTHITSVPSDALRRFTTTTFAMIKSGAVSRGQDAAIIGEALAAGFGIVQMLRVRLTPEQACAFYAEHEGREYHAGLIASVTEGDVVIAEIGHDGDAIALWRNLLGATDPQSAAPGTIRARFGIALPDNAAHGSDSPTSARHECALAFGWFA